MSIRNRQREHAERATSAAAAAWADVLAARFPANSRAAAHRAFERELTAALRKTVRDIEQRQEVT